MCCVFQSVDRVPSPCQLDWSAEPLHLLHSPVRQQYQVHIETPATLCHTLSLSLSVVRHIWRSTTTSPTGPSLISLLRYTVQLSQVSQCVQTPQLNCSDLCPLSLSLRSLCATGQPSRCLDIWSSGPKLWDCSTDGAGQSSQ